MTPTPEREAERRVVVASDRIYIQWSDDGQHIRKWSREPFEGGEAFSRQAILDHWRRGARPLPVLIPDYLPPFPADL